MSWMRALVFEVDGLCTGFFFFVVGPVEIFHESGNRKLFMGGAPGGHDSAAEDNMEGVVCCAGFGLMGGKGECDGSLVCGSLV